MPDWVMWIGCFLASRGRVILRCEDCGQRACPSWSFRDMELPHAGRCEK